MQPGCTNVMACFGQGKSEVRIRCAGTGSATVRRNALVDATEDVSIRWAVPDLGPFFELRMVDEYKHLGSLISAAGTADRDVAVRLGAMVQASKGFVRRLFPDDEVTDIRKLTVLTVYLFTKGMSHIGTWRVLGPKVEHKIHSTIMRLYRHAVSETWKSENGTQLVDEAVIQKYGLTTPLNMVVLAMMQLFGRIVLKAPSCVLQLLAAAANANSKSWLAAVAADIKFLVSMPHIRASGMAELLGRSPSAIASWVEAFRKSPSTCWP